MDQITQTSSQQIPDVSEKNTKKELMDAYKELVHRYKKEAAMAPDQKKQEKQRVEQATLMEVSKLKTGSDEVASSIHQVRIAITHSLEEIQRKLEQEFTKFSSLEKAVQIQNTRLKELYEIEEAADMLFSLLRAREEQQALMKNEQSLRVQEKTREEEEYQYALNKKRRQDEDERKAARKTFEEEITIQKEQLTLREKEWEEKNQEHLLLKSQVEAFPQKLQEEKDRACQIVEERVKQEGETKLLIALKEFETQKAVLESRVDGLNATIQDQRSQINNLQHQLQAALNQIQEMTLRAIDVHADSRALNAVNTIAMEQAKGHYSSHPPRS